MGDPLRIGIVGCGVVTTRDLLPNLILPEVQERLALVAVCDIVGDRAMATATRFGAPKHYTDPAQLASDPDIDAVAVMTPVPHHLSAALAAVRAGKHVYVQKTLTETVADADLLIEAARQAGVKIAAAPGNHLRSPALAEIRAAIRAGQIGKVCWGRAVKGTRHEDDARRNDSGEADVDPTWYYRPGGGPLRDAAVYDLHALTWLLGPAKRVTAMSGIAMPVRQWKDRLIDVTLDDNTHFILDFGEACYVVVSSHFIKGSSRTPSMELYGERGAIVMAGGGYEIFGEGQERDRHGLRERLLHTGAPAPAGSSQTGLHHFVAADLIELADAVAEDRTPRLAAEQARHVVEIIDKVYESARVGQALALSTTFDWS